MLLSFLSGCKKKEVKNIKSFHFSYSNGCMAYSSDSYDLEKKDDVYTVTYKPRYVPDKDAIKLTVDKSFADGLENLINSSSAVKWDKFSKNNKNVLDGDSFSFSVYYEDGSISAHGYMSWPEGYSSVKSRICSYFDALFEDSKFYTLLGDPMAYRQIDKEALKAEYPALFDQQDKDDPVVVVYETAPDSICFSLENKEVAENPALFVRPAYRLNAVQVKAVIDELDHIPCSLEIVYISPMISSFRRSQEEAEEILNAVKCFLMQD